MGSPAWDKNAWCTDYVNTECGGKPGRQEWLLFCEGSLRSRGYKLSSPGLEIRATPLSFSFLSLKVVHKAFKEQKPHRAIWSLLHWAWPPGKGHAIPPEQWHLKISTKHLSPHPHPGEDQQKHLANTNYTDHSFVPITKRQNSSTRGKQYMELMDFLPMIL